MPPLNLDASFLFASLFWGSVGSAFFIYGFKQREFVTVFGGVALMAVSYFIESWFCMSLVSIALIPTILWLKRRF